MKVTLYLWMLINVKERFCKQEQKHQAWMVCRVQLNVWQRFCKWEQNHRACLNDLSSAAEYSTKILQMRAKSLSLLECFAECSWILCKVTLSFSRTQRYSLLHISQSYMSNVCIYIKNRTCARYRFLQNTSVEVSISWLSVW